jgi:hypothetical protein
MGTKRSHAQMSSNGSSLIHPSRKSNISPPKRKRRRTPEKPTPTSVNPLKKRVRDLTRLLERAENMSADVRMDNERALAAYKQELVAAEEEKLKKKMAKKYHMVKFFGMCDTIGAPFNAATPIYSWARISTGNL